jgi:hypothetical protein
MLILKLSLALQLVLSSTNKLIKHSKSLPQLNMESENNEIQNDTQHGKRPNTATILENVNNTTEKPLKIIFQLNPNAQEFFPKKNILTELSTSKRVMNIIANFLDGKSQSNLVKVNRYMFDNYAEIVTYTIPVGYSSGSRSFNHDTNETFEHMDGNRYHDLERHDFMKILKHAIQDNIINHKKLPTIVKEQDLEDCYLGSYLENSVLYLEYWQAYYDESDGEKLQVNIDDNSRKLEVTRISHLCHQYLDGDGWDSYDEVTYIDAETSYRTVDIIRFRNN